MEIPINKYQTNSVYTLSNGWYIELTEDTTGLTTLKVKSPEGAPLNDLTRTIGQDITANPINLKSNIEGDVTFLSSYLLSPELKVTHIAPKEALPFPETTNKIKIVGKVVTKEGSAIPEVKVKFNLFQKPPPPASLSKSGTTYNSLDEFEAAQTDFNGTTFTIGGAALILDPEFTGDDGTFELVLLEEDGVDFNTSYVEFSKEEYFPKSIGPKLVKSGEITEKVPIKEESNTKIELNTYVAGESLFQEGDGTYRAVITLKDLERGNVAQGEGKSQDREIAKKKARNKAEQKLTKKAIEESNKLPIYTLSNGYIIKFATQGPKTKATAFTPGEEFFWEGEWSFTAEVSILTQEAIIAVENLTNIPNGTLKVTGSDPIQPLPTPQEEDSKVKFDLYDLGRIILDPVKVDIEQEIVEAQIQLQEEENKIVEVKEKTKVPFEAKMAILFDTLKERLKRMLIPYVLNLISQFGPQVLHNLTSGKKNPLSDKICLPSDKLKKVLEKRNKLVKQINNYYKIIRIISKVLRVAEAVILGLKIGIRVAQAVGATPFTYTSLVETGIKEAEKLIRKAEPTISKLSLTAATLGVLFGFILSLLDLVDTLIQECAEEIDPETGEFVLTFSEINEEVGKFKDPTTPSAPIGVIDPLTGKPFPYKGFTFEIKDDISQNFQYPKRYAIARNVQGIQVLRSESSFASDPSILIEELKFVIDRDGLRAD